MSQIDKALAIAAIAHRNQVRKGTDIPYFVHPVRVGMILVEYGCSDDVICAGILHDTVEDTDMTLSILALEFNDNIARIVEGCSEPNKGAPWVERKQHTIAEIKNVDKEIGHVICADKLHNLKSIIEDKKMIGDSIWFRFNRGAEKQEWYYKGIIESFKMNETMKNSRILRDLSMTVKELFA